MGGSGTLSKAWDKTVDGLGRFLMVLTNTAATTHAAGSDVVDAVPYNYPQPPLKKRSGGGTLEGNKEVGDGESVGMQEGVAGQQGK